MKAHMFQKIWRFGKEFVNLRIDKIAARRDGDFELQILNYELTKWI